MKNSRKPSRIKAQNVAKNGGRPLLARTFAGGGAVLVPLMIFTLGATCFCWLATIEAPLVYTLYQNPWVNFEQFMARSIYEGGAFGGSDVGVTLGILAYLLWLARRGANSQKFFFTQQELKFVWMSSLFSALIFIHSLKWIVSRVRPKLFFTETPDWTIKGLDLATLKWPGFLSFDAPRGIGWNSFPSGHAGSVAILLCYAYIFRRKNRYLGIAIGLLVFLYSSAMTVARSMGGMHWLTDGVASFFGVWVIIHIFAGRMQINPQR